MKSHKAMLLAKQYVFSALLASGAALGAAQSSGTLAAGQTLPQVAVDATFSQRMQTIQPCSA